MDKVDLRADLENRIYKREKKNNVPKWFFLGALAACTVGMLIYWNNDVATLNNQGNKKQPGALNQLIRPDFLRHFFDS